MHSLTSTGMVVCALLSAWPASAWSQGHDSRPSDTPPTAATVRVPADLASIRPALLDRVRKREVPSLSVGVIRDGVILWEESIGWADRQASQPATPFTRYPVASVSKSITATGALALVAEGALRLDQPVQQALKPFSLNREGESVNAVLVSQLLSHTSGIPHLWHYEFPDRPNSIVRRERLIRDHAFVAVPPGERFVYSNLGFAVLAHVVEVAGGAPFQRVMERVLLKPLGMQRTTVGAWVGQRGTVRGYDGGGKRIPYRYRLAPDGGAGFFSSVHDLLQYAHFHLGAGEQATPSRSAAIADAVRAAPVGGHYLRGWGVVRLRSATVLISDGESAGGTAVVVLVPEKQLGVVVLCNQTGGPATESATSILTALIPGFAEQFRAAASAVDAEMSTPGVQPSGQFEGFIAGTTTRIAAGVDFSHPAAPLLRLGTTTYPLKVTGWDNGALQATVEGASPLGVGIGRTRRLLLTLWPRGGVSPGLRGVAQEDLFDDRPRSGTPYFVRLEAVQRP